MIWLILWEKLQTRLCLKRRYCRGNWQHKSEKRYRHLFRHRTCGFFQSHFATEYQHDVQNSRIWCMLKLCENAEIWFKNLQNAWIHSLNWFTSHRHSAFCVSQKCFVQNPVWWIHLTTTLWHPKIWPKIPALLQPLQAPPARLFTSSCPPAGLQDGKGWGDLHPHTV